MNNLPQKLTDILQTKSSLAVALSGGLDSRFLCHAALLCNCDVVALHITGPHITNEESGYAKNWAQGVGLPFYEVNYNPLLLPEVANNMRNRCYFCKKAIFTTILKWLSDNGMPDRILCDGSNKDDLKVYRPGLKAVRELDVLSPLAMAELGKKEIQDFARKSGLENPHQMARPCLLTRFAYNQPVHEDDLRKAAETEKGIQKVLQENLSQIPDFRLRLLPEPELHFTFLPEGLRDKIAEVLEKNSFYDCQIKIIPRLSGFFDSQ